MKYNYKIIIDGLTALKDEYLNDERFAFIPNFGKDKNTEEEKALLNAYDTEAEHIYVVTPALGETEDYATALEAADLFEQANNTELNIHIVDSREEGKSALQIIEEIIRFEEIGLSFDEIVGRIEVFKNAVYGILGLNTVKTV